MSVLDSPAIPKAATVLVTGAAGWVGSNVADQFLAYGYKVRGTTRDATKAAWIVEVFDKKYGKGQFELHSVSDMVAEGAYDDVIKGVSAVVHTASLMSADPNPHNVIPMVVDSAVNALKAAYAEPSVDRFIYTSSSSAAVRAQRGEPGINVTVDSWADDDVKRAWAEPPYLPERARFIYAASKYEAEKVIWKYHQENRENRPGLIVNAVLPNVNYGKPLDFEKQGYPSTSALPVGLYNGDISPYHQIIAPQYYVNASDTGRLHVAAAIHPDVKDERIFAFAGRFSWDAILEILRKNFPNKEFIDNFSGGEDLNEILPRSRAEQLLRDLGRPGWVSLEETVLENVKDIVDRE
ncbi:hypothetical protein G7Z17_g6787 [Cylindrodendrum hubeiense]|uniref:NAD-dependent epimerase/dehydratase domain-containing protein n=1 Tax=Cylindrodendrum hubeiense TaxID=595255 RepID=A0A9P5H430_9HYPO|nr:hypothetical protein G7Z17_g6787 [Cylindrodendrum hubeiense]